MAHHRPGRVEELERLRQQPELVQPVQAGKLWKNEGLMRRWTCDWYTLRGGLLLVADGPQQSSRQERALPGPVAQARLLSQRPSRGGQAMHGFEVVDSGLAALQLYCEDPAQAGRWVAALQAACRPQPWSLDQIYDIQWGQILGSGLFSTVVRAKARADGTPVALKVLTTDAYQEYRDLLDREQSVWQALGSGHPHVVGLHAAWQSPTRLYHAMEPCEGGGLLSRLARMSDYCEATVASIFRQLLAALSHLHAQGILHMDVKPENIVYATPAPDSPIKLIDFSLACFFNTPTEPGGTPEFVAPELLADPEKYAAKGCDASVDMWAVGVVLYYLLCGRTPFDAPDADQILAKVKSGKWAFRGKIWHRISMEARDLVSRLLQWDPSKRLSAAEALQHGWLRSPPAQPGSQLLETVGMFKAACGSNAAARSSWIRRSGVIQYQLAVGMGGGAEAAPWQQFPGGAPLGGALPMVGQQAAVMQSVPPLTSAPSSSSLLPPGALAQQQQQQQQLLQSPMAAQQMQMLHSLPASAPGSRAPSMSGIGTLLAMEAMGASPVASYGLSAQPSFDSFQSSYSQLPAAEASAQMDQIAAAQQMLADLQQRVAEKRLRQQQQQGGAPPDGQASPHGAGSAAHTPGSLPAASLSTTDGGYSRQLSGVSPSSQGSLHDAGMHVAPRSASYTAAGSSHGNGSPHTAGSSLRQAVMQQQLQQQLHIMALKEEQQ